jgi:uncharacterized protein YdhG (YjbR/CyaY superfamily)
MRQTVSEAAPEAIEAISYQMPTFKQNGNLVHSRRLRTTLGFIHAFELNNLRQDYRNIKHRKALCNSHDKPIPFDLVERIVTFRVQEVLQKQGLRC